MLSSSHDNRNVDGYHFLIGITSVRTHVGRHRRRAKVFGVNLGNKLPVRKRVMRKLDIAIAALALAGFVNGPASAQVGKGLSGAR